MGLKTRRLVRTTSAYPHAQKCKTLRAAGTIRLFRLAADEAVADTPTDYAVDDEETRNSGTEIYFLPLPKADTFN
jgi:hypothetical protein